MTEQEIRKACIAAKRPFAGRLRSTFVPPIINPSRIALVGEAPGEEEELQEKPFVGQSGQILDSALREAGISLRTCYVTNLVKFRPCVDQEAYGEKQKGNRAPTWEEILAFRPILVEELTDLAPKVIVTLGASALKGLTGSETKSISKCEGRVYEWSFREGPTYFLVPLYHPAYILRSGGVGSLGYNDYVQSIKKTILRVLKGDYDDN